jgi:3-dehydroquinate dehydratase-1
MTRRDTVKGSANEARIVGVIASIHDLQRALKLRTRPDYFELRLDALVSLPNESIDEMTNRLSVPLIVTARHPNEGGANNLSASRRRDLLLRYLPKAACVDVELRSVRQFQSVIAAARARGVRLILSAHDFAGTPSLARLKKLAAAAHASGADVFKIAVRTDEAADLARLRQFFGYAQELLPTSAMGMGKLGRRSRRELARRGSVLNYAHLGGATVAGQLSIAEFRTALSKA